MPQKIRAQTKPELYPIRTVATITGVNPITLRAWERRYGLVKPVRTASGRRLYTQDNIDTIHRVVSLLEKGIAISQAQLALRSVTNTDTAVSSASVWNSYRAEMLAAITQFDENRLENTYNEILALYPNDLVTRSLLLPLLTELGTRWETAVGSVAEEHFFGVYLRNKLGARFHHRYRHSNGPKLLAACLPGEQHEIGLLLFALAANDAGFQPVLLGGDMPLADLPYAARRAQCAAIVLSGSIEPDGRLFSESLPGLVRISDVPVYVGGLTSTRHHDAIGSAGAHALGTDIKAGLRRLGEEIANAPDRG